MGSIVPPQSTNVALTQKTDYCGNMIYENGRLSKILTDVGYITLANSTPTYHYYLQDHLGNNRVVIDEHGQVEQVNHYYAFGGLMGESTGGGAQPYKYNGKELDRMHGLDWYDYGARHYDAVLTTLDIGGSLYKGITYSTIQDQLYYLTEGIIKTLSYIPYYGTLWGLGFEPVVRPTWENGTKNIDNAIKHGADPAIIFIIPGLLYVPSTK